MALARKETPSTTRLPSPTFILGTGTWTDSSIPYLDLRVPCAVVLGSVVEEVWPVREGPMAYEEEHVSPQSQLVDGWRPRAAQDLPCREGRYTFNMSTLSVFSLVLNSSLDRELMHRPHQFTEAQEEEVSCQQPSCCFFYVNAIPTHPNGIPNYFQQVN
ncbi:hypothetical protein TNCV_3941241 [Trichonephila clavipes]|uniref:Uncharacterized protein n=1 Tax=Trichonephila clavipes TaxID=2585209 RepID=A0A8X7B8K6_TRICX|nr:hypothetical protein TNCV_3941241 [Trichonephila clavipes]